MEIRTYNAFIHLFILWLVRHSTADVHFDLQVLVTTKFVLFNSHMLTSQNESPTLLYCNNFVLTSYISGTTDRLSLCDSCHFSVSTIRLSIEDNGRLKVISTIQLIAKE